MIDITEILAHWYAGRSQHDVAGSLGVARGTIRRYVEPAIAAGFVPGGPPMSQADWAPLVKQWFPHLTDTRLRQVTWPDFDKHREYIVEMLRAGVTKATIHQRLRDEHEVTGSLASPGAGVGCSRHPWHGNCRRSTSARSSSPTTTASLPSTRNSDAPWWGYSLPHNRALLAVW